MIPMPIWAKEYGQALLIYTKEHSAHEKKSFQSIAHHKNKNLHQKSTFWSSNQNLVRLTLDGAFQSNCRLVLSGTKAEGFSGVSNMLTVTAWLSVHHISSEWQAKTFLFKK